MQDDYFQAKTKPPNNVKLVYSKALIHSSINVGVCQTEIKNVITLFYTTLKYNFAKQLNWDLKLDL